MHETDEEYTADRYRRFMNGISYVLGVIIATGLALVFFLGLVGLASDPVLLLAVLAIVALAVLSVRVGR